MSLLIKKWHENLGPASQFDKHDKISNVTGIFCIFFCFKIILAEIYHYYFEHPKSVFNRLFEDIIDSFLYLQKH